MRILHILNGLNVGGVEAFLKNLSKSFDGDGIQMDFLLRSRINDKETIEFFKKRDSNIYIMPDYPKHFWRNHKDTSVFLKQNIERYDFIHIHANSLFYYYPIDIASKFFGESRVIVHSHNTGTTSHIGLLIHKWNQRWLTYRNIKRLACSNEAGHWMFGRDNFTVINNSIDTDCFCATPDNRKELKKRYGINSPVLLCVGRLVEQKNHIFLISVVKELVVSYPNIQLWICGSGTLKNELEQNIVSEHLEENIKLLGDRIDIPELLKIADVYLMPSLYEGLSVSAIEAQTAGIPTLLSNLMPKETKKVDNCKFLALEEKKWIDEIEQLLETDEYGYQNYKKIKLAGYGLDTLRNAMLSIYK